MRRWLLPTPGSHLVQLDALRAVAVLGVMLTHFAPATKSLVPFGDFGVRLFFVLSGFLITGILLRPGVERPRLLRQFYARRFLRIFPAFYLVLFAAAALAVPGIREALGWSASYTSNFWFIFHTWHNPNYTNHLWTLAVEEQFYLVAPAVVLFAPRRHLRTILLSAIAAGVAYRLGAVAAGWSWDASTRAPSACLDSLGLGALLAVTRSRGLSDRWTAWGLALGLPLLAIDLAGNVMATHNWSYSLLNFQHVMQDTAFALVSVWLVARASRGFGGLTGKMLSLSPLVYLGTISYGIYLYHYFAIWGFWREFGWYRGVYPNQAMYFLTLTGATIAAASISWFAVERPLNGLKRLFPYESGQPRTQQESWGTVAAGRALRHLHPAPATAQRSLQWARKHVFAAILLAGVSLFLLFVWLPEALGDRPYDVFGLRF